MSDDIYVSQSEFTRRWNSEFTPDTISRQYVSKLANDGTFPKIDGKIPFKKCKDILIEKKQNVEREAQRLANQKRKEDDKLNLFSKDVIPKDSIATMTPEQKEDLEKKILVLEEKLDNEETEKHQNLEIEDFNTATFNDVKKFKEYYQGLQSKFNYEKDKGDFVKIEDVKKDAFELAQLTKNKLLTIPSRVCAIFASMSDKREIQAYLYDEIYNALSELSNEC